MKRLVTKIVKSTKKTVAPPVKPKKAAPVALPPEPVAATEPPSKRVSPGASIQEWRVVASQRRGQQGWFLQGGSYAKTNGRNAFTCGTELFFESRTDAQAALKEKQQAAA